MRKRQRKKIAVKDWDELAEHCRFFLKCHDSFNACQKAALSKVHKKVIDALSNSVHDGIAFYSGERVEKHVRQLQFEF
jgi:hypothetical protein